MVIPALLVPARDVSVLSVFRDQQTGRLFRKLAHDRRADVGLAESLDGDGYWDVPGGLPVEVMVTN